MRKAATAILILVAVAGAVLWLRAAAGDGGGADAVTGDVWEDAEGDENPPSRGPGEGTDDRGAGAPPPPGDGGHGGGDAERLPDARYTTFDEWVAAGLDGGPTSLESEDYFERVRHLAAVFLEHPEAMREAARALREPDFQWKSEVIEALGLASKQAPHDVHPLLRDLLIDDGVDESLQVTLATVTAWAVPMPDATVSLLGRLSLEDGDLAAWAAMALGDAGRADLGEAASAVREQVDDLLLRAYRAHVTAGNEYGSRVALESLARLGTAAGKREVQRALRSGAVIQRKAAADAVRYVDNDWGQERLAELIASDPEPAVRLRAIWNAVPGPVEGGSYASAHVHLEPASLRQAICRAVMQDRDADVRHAAAERLHDNWSPGIHGNEYVMERPGIVLEAMRHAARQAEDEWLRNYARETLLEYWREPLE